MSRRKIEKHPNFEPSIYEFDVIDIEYSSEMRDKRLSRRLIVKCKERKTGTIMCEVLRGTEFDQILAILVDVATGYFRCRKLSERELTESVSGMMQFLPDISALIDNVRIYQYASFGFFLEESQEDSLAQKAGHHEFMMRDTITAYILKDEVSIYTAKRLSKFKEYILTNFDIYFSTEMIGKLYDIYIELLKDGKAFVGGDFIN